MAISFQVIEQLLERNDPKSICKCCTHLSGELHFANSIINLLKKCLDQYIPKTIFNKPLIIVDKDISLKVYATYMFIIILESNDPKGGLKWFKKVVENYKDLKYPLLTTEEAKIMLSLVDNKLIQKISINFSDNPLRIFILPYHLNGVNSSCNPYLNHIIVGQIDVELASNPQYVFLHEIGHILDKCLTENSERPPLSFKRFLVDKKVLSNDRYYEDDPIAIADLFADCFAMAMLHNSSYANLNPFRQYKEFSESSYDYLILLTNNIPLANV